MAEQPLDGQTQLTGIIGWPVAHSFSPIMHNAAFAALGLNWRYVPLPVREADLPAAIRGLAALGFRGVNVTVPHKTAVISLLDSIDDSARAIGAVNTIRIDQITGALHGMNTDLVGFKADLAGNQIRLDARSQVVILGAGGAARACIAGVLETGAVVTLVNRTPTRAESVLRDFPQAVVQGKLNAIGWEALPALRGQGISLIVNATSVGMWPEVDNSPWPTELPFPTEAVVYDTIYRPPRTQLMIAAEQAGLRAIGGLGMLINQGAAAFELWTGQPAPVAIMRNTWQSRG